VLRSAMIFGGGLLQALDPVLLNQWLGTPLPSDPTFFSGLHGFAVIACTAGVVIVIGVMLFLLAGASREVENWVIDAFLLVAGLLPVLPVLMLTDHPSETYLYLTIALMAVVLMSMLYDLYQARFVNTWVFVIFTIFMTVVFGSATWVRNQRVAACGATARKILNGISFQGLSNGASIAFTDAPGDHLARPYGFYRFDGLNTIANRAGSRSRKIQCAVQLLSGDDKITGEVLDSVALSRMESGLLLRQFDSLVVVHADGGVIQYMLSTR